MKKRFLLSLLIIAIFSAAISASAAEIGQTSSWYAYDSSTMRVNYFTYGALNGGTRCDWTYILQRLC